MIQILWTSHQSHYTSTNNWLEGTIGYLCEGSSNTRSTKQGARSRSSGKTFALGVTQHTRTFDEKRCSTLYFVQVKNILISEPLVIPKGSRFNVAYEQKSTAFSTSGYRICQQHKSHAATSLGCFTHPWTFSSLLDNSFWTSANNNSCQTEQSTSGLWWLSIVDFDVYIHLPRWALRIPQTDHWLVWTSSRSKKLDSIFCVISTCGNIVHLSIVGKLFFFPTARSVRLSYKQIVTAIHPLSIVSTNFFFLSAISPFGGPKVAMRWESGSGREYIARLFPF